MATWFMDTSLSEKETKKHSKIPRVFLISDETAEMEFTISLFTGTGLSFPVFPTDKYKGDPSRVSVQVGKLERDVGIIFGQPVTYFMTIQRTRAPT
jgi:hypothetical protein